MLDSMIFVVNRLGRMEFSTRTGTWNEPEPRVVCWVTGHAHEGALSLAQRVNAPRTAYNENDIMLPLSSM